MRRTVIESPYAGHVERNVKYARECIKDALTRGEAPLASHLLYTQEGILDDADVLQRRIGMEAGWEWIKYADAVVLYTDLGISEGMKRGKDIAELLGVPTEERKIYDSPVTGSHSLLFRY